MNMWLYINCLLWLKPTTIEKNVYVYIYSELYAQLAPAREFTGLEFSYNGKSKLRNNSFVVRQGKVLMLPLFTSVLADPMEPHCSIVQEEKIFRKLNKVEPLCDHGHGTSKKGKNMKKILLTSLTTSPSNGKESCYLVKQPGNQRARSGRRVGLPNQCSNIPRTNSVVNSNL